MALIEAIIGRESEQRRLLVKVGQATYTIGTQGSVPNSVSREHCKMTIEVNGETGSVSNVKIQNLKAANQTFVNGFEIDTKYIDTNSTIQLGRDMYLVDLEQVLNYMRKNVKIEYSISHLQTIWEEYDSTRIKLQLDEQKKNNMRNLGGILGGVGVLFMFIPELGNLRWCATALSVIIGVVFFIRGMKTDSSLTVKLHDLDAEFRKKYVCPNPNCRHFLGMVPFDVLRQNSGCPSCKCTFKKE